MDIKELVSGFRQVATASVSDAVDKIVGKTGFFPESIRPRTEKNKIVGPAVTVLEVPSTEYLPPEHALEAIDQAEAGSVIVISTNGQAEIALWGGLMTAGAVANGHEAAVLDGGVRDIAEINQDFDFPVFSRTVSPGTTLGRLKTIASNVEITIGSVTVSPGDIIVGDTDGVVCVARQYAEEVLKTSREIEAREIEQKRLIIESGSLREGLAKYGRI